ncbi:hypothetical protein DFQ11_103118 [Winogradskyella epiphytica]|uniref:Uncharacterized protein n=1 Tax=Winogradskyella epiphytica TaxID=262005 RepID=A0A2V4XYU6_9FLAO|nr:hypothetical protein [Winogradskyella epiphytica]PYE81038.1 hypothetical protein DFQ11_103118 [Winogradskyella epiphytica]GGW66394.1 hypothetical protein GCM10008085_17810 [Winogradskyella epiphytica]
MKTNTFNNLKRTVFLITLTLFIYNCSDDSGVTPQPCLDFNFYGLQIEGNFGNPTGQLDFIKNTAANLANPSLQVLSSLIITGNLYSNRPAFDRTNETLYFIDEFNGGQKMYVAAPGTLDEIILSPAASYSAPIYLGNQLYALEFDTSGIFLCTISASGVAVRIGGAIGTNEYYQDTVGNKAYGVASISGSLLFLVGQVLYEVTSTGSLLSAIPVNTTAGYAMYSDIEIDPETGGLFLPKMENGARSIVHWDFSSGAIVESTIIPSIEFNPESVNLAYNNCGDRLLVLSNGTYINNTQENSRIWELEIQNSPNPGVINNSNAYTDLLLGLVF